MLTFSFISLIFISWEKRNWNSCWWGFKICRGSSNGKQINNTFGMSYKFYKTGVLHIKLSSNSLSYFSTAKAVDTVISKLQNYTQSFSTAEEEFIWFAHLSPYLLNSWTSFPFSHWKSKERLAFLGTLSSASSLGSCQSGFSCCLFSNKACILMASSGFVQFPASSRGTISPWNGH